MQLVSGGSTTRKIQDLNGLMGIQPIDQKRGPIEDKILKLLVNGDQQMHEAQVKIEKIRQ